MLGAPAPADPESAAALLGDHLKRYWSSRRPGELGITVAKLDALHVIAQLPALRADGTRDTFFVKLGGEYYDAWPPTVAFVEPDAFAEAADQTRWFPKFRQTPSWFGLQASHQFTDGHIAQLVCFTFTAQYYMTSHGPRDDQVWQQGRHTVAATISRLIEILRAPYYECPAG